MFGLPEVYALPLLTSIGVFALVGLVWNLAEGWFEDQRKDQR
jgi:hypothetical protein